MLGLPVRGWWLPISPWYNNAELDNQLRMALP
jgi:hypothetical protein